MKQVWVDFPKYAPVLDKVVNRWWYRTERSWDRDELYNECVLAYHDVYETYRSRVPEKEFVRILFRSCSNRLYDLIVSKKLEVEIEKVRVSIGLDEFQQMFEKLWLEDVMRLLSDDAKALVSFILDKDKAKEVNRDRKASLGFTSRKSGLCKEDLFYYFRKELKWNWRRIWAAIKEVRRVLRLFS